ncbi:MAG: beta-lactamase family protein, partial [Verrucomicrobia bacterium]|nr:beta-lactamase family protein [Verrucomicrobiota bacterium]
MLETHHFACLSDQTLPLVWNEFRLVFHFLPYDDEINGNLVNTISHMENFPLFAPDIKINGKYSINLNCSAKMSGAAVLVPRRDRTGYHYQANMMTIQWLLPLIFLQVILSGCSRQFSDFDVGIAGDGNLNNVLEHIRADHGLPALAVILVRSGEVVESEAVGVRAVGSPEQVTLSDRWHLGSNTKSMTATLAGLLVEEGAIRWETTIGEVFPNFPERTRPEYKNVRLEELFSQTAGLPKNEMQIPSYSKSRQSTETLSEQRRQWTRELLALEPEAQRGTHHYANANYVVAAAMLETVAGKPWEEMLRQKILNPLGMTSTGFGAPGTRGQVPDQP